jgi:hypothetical protein
MQSVSLFCLSVVYYQIISSQLVLFLFFPLVFVWFCIHYCFTQCECQWCDAFHQCVPSSPPPNLCEEYWANSGCSATDRNYIQFSDNDTKNDDSAENIQYTEKIGLECNCFCCAGLHVCQMHDVPLDKEREEETNTIQSICSLVLND